MPYTPAVLVHLHRGQPWSVNPLMRVSDRVQAAVRILAAVAILAAVPVAGAIGTADYTRATAQIQADNTTKTEVTATITATPSNTVTRASAAGSYGAAQNNYHAPVSWTYRGKPGSATVEVPASAQRGGQVRIWLGPNGTQTTEPVPSITAAFRGVAAAVAMLVMARARLCR